LEGAALSAPPPERGLAGAEREATTERRPRKGKRRMRTGYFGTFNESDDLEEILRAIQRSRQDHEDTAKHWTIPCDDRHTEVSH